MPFPSKPAQPVTARLCLLALTGVLVSAQDFHSKEKESALGVSMAGDVRHRTSSIPDSTVHDYIESIGTRLAAHVPGENLNWDFGVIRDDLGGSTHEALSIPGGHVFIPASLILAADSEAELAGMLAHSMAHIAQRHSTRMAAPATLSSIPLVFIGSWMGMGAGDDDRTLLPLGYLKTQRAFELDADRVAVNIVAAAGYEPAALLEYIRRTQRALTTGSATHSALPPRDERILALETAIASLSSRAGRPAGEFKSIQDRVRRLTVRHYR
jgi:predicted Zn-dependent protease